MALTGTTFRGELARLGSVLPKEFDEWASVDAGWKTLEHNEEGMHTDITATTVRAQSFTVIGDSAPMGVWFRPGYRTDYFSASGAMTWTVERDDVLVYKYMIIGSTMTLQFTIADSSVGGTPDTQLLIVVPGGYVAVDSTFSVVRADDNGVPSAAVAIIDAGSDFVSVFLDSGFPSTNWSASTDATNVYGQITFEIKRV